MLQILEDAGMLPPPSSYSRNITDEVVYVYYLEDEQSCYDNILWEPENETE